MLKLRRKRPEIEILEDQVQRKSLELERRLLESQFDWLDNLVDPRSAFIDEQTGERWDAIGSASFTQESAEPFNSAEELRMIRQRCRKIARNPYAQNLLVNLQSFIVGKGHTYNVCGRKNIKEAYYNPYVAKLQYFIDELLKLNRWKKRQKEIVKRLHRDGEALIRIFPQSDGYAKFRFVEPAQLKTPTGWAGDQSASYGIKCDPEDVETVEYYFIDDEEVEAHEVQHRKANVDSNCKRGLSSLWCVMSNLDRGKQLLTNMSTLLQTRAAIAMIRRHNKSSSAVRSFVNRSDVNPIQYRNPVTQENVKGKPMRPASVIDSTKDVEYEFPSLNASASDGTSVLAAELRAIASSKALAEYMVGADASNANYASTMVAESPAVRFFEGEQDEMIEMDLELIWAAVDYAIDAGVLPKECRDFCDIEVSPPQLVTRQPLEDAQANDVYLRNRVKSPQTIRGELGIDSAQEDKNFAEFDSTHLEGGPLPLDGGADINAGGALPPTQDAVVAAADPEAALLNMAGGITGYLEIMTKLNEGIIHREQAVNAMMTFFKLTQEEAERMVG